MKKNFTILIIIIALAIIVTILLLGFKPTTEQFKDADGNIIEESIAIIEEVELGNMKQWITIRGKDTSNPVLLWLHGGPGSPQMSLAHELDGKLEEEFIVVHWDQRGAGKSNHSDFDDQTMTVNQFKNDAIDLIKYLQKRLNKDKIYLLGHSWGSQLGIELVNDSPEYFYAYIGVSQVVDSHRGVKIAYDWLLEEIQHNNDQTSLNKLAKIGVPPYSHSQYRDFAQLVNLYGGNLDIHLSKLALISVKAPEYTFLDYYHLINGMNRGGAPLHQNGEMLSINTIKEIPSVEIPIFFFNGKNDYNTPLVLVEEYLEMIKAPQKDLIIFNHSSHTPFLKENDKFSEKIINIKEQMDF
ncbi:hypothetical protein SYNTR_0010 [Candidatus Syntrophocurvum alkaliphilum]|uniref:prolyl aminopeptidase n=1 Tax=Candidatus Syntrophocurvum alkaliphilum TaxID=2293317 RepID=A0A6I6D5A2_9FIRM|nr:alpha/beta hydrolase [Candidatus Syntrophocurvum alkaliphilum]QGT98603.1 hypothetical protein SYNTR_0010 [Candidatus Syntrophocurvum alkaliphilum]